MSKQNVAIARLAIDAFNRGDPDAALKDAAPDFELDFSRAIGPQHGVFRLDQMRQFWNEFVGAWESIQIEPEEFREAGDHVVVPVAGHMRGRDGIEVTARRTWVFTIRDGAIARLCQYRELREALEATRVRE